MRTQFLSVVTLGVALAFGCATHEPQTPFANYARRPQPVPGTYVDDVVPVYVDKAFSADQRRSIHEALDEWTFALNGYRTFLVVSDAFTMADDAAIERVMVTHQGMIVLARASDALPMGLPAGTLAWVPELCHPVVNVIVDRIGTRDMRAIVMHEIGHTMCLDHTEASGTLMSGYYQDQTSCVDRYTATTLAGTRRARAVRWDWRHMNVCERPS